MELIYIWIDKFRTFEKTGINLTDKYEVKYNEVENTIDIAENKEYISIYPDNIKNINLIIGKNSAGKTNLLDLIGQRTDSRYNEEVFIEYDQAIEKNDIFEYPKVKNKTILAQYFLVYYMGKDEHNNNLFCLEGNDISNYKDLINNQGRISAGYFQSKHWFSFLCKIQDNTFEFIRDMNIEDTKETSLSNRKDFVIVNLREKHNTINLNHSFNREFTDESRISIPRRIVFFDSKLLHNKIEFLYKQLNHDNNSLYNENNNSLYNEKEYEIIINYKHNPRRLIKLKTFDQETLTDNQIGIAKMLRSMCYYFFSNPSFFREVDFKEELTSEGTELKNKIHEMPTNINSFTDLVKFYRKCLIFTIDLNYDEGLSEDDSGFNEDACFFCNCFDSMIEALSINKEEESCATIKDEILIKLTANSDIIAIKNILEKIVDVRIFSEVQEQYNPFHGFFSYKINYLSDGEIAYLSLMSSISEQIKYFAATKNNYIILLDEPEVRFHPELARTFLHNLNLLLSQFPEKTFQLIISSHSPFLESDVLMGNVNLLEKNGNRTSVKKPEKQTFSQNIHTLLTDSFFLNKTQGKISVEKIDEVIKFINKSKNPPVTKEEVEKNIKIAELIGEPIIRKALLYELKELLDSEERNIVTEFNNLSEEQKEELRKLISDEV